MKLDARGKSNELVFRDVDWLGSAKMERDSIDYCKVRRFY